MPFNLFSGDPQNQAMLALTAGLLESGGPSRMPVGVGQGIARGMMGGRQAYMEALEAQRRADLVNTQKMEIMRRMNAPQGYGPGTQLIGPDGKVIHSVPFAPRPAPAAPGPESPLGKLSFDLKQGLITQEQFDEQFKKLTAPTQPLVTVDNRQGTEFDKAVGKELGDQYSTLLKSDMSAATTIAKYQRLGGLLSQVNTGKFRGTVTDMKAAAKSMGFDLTAMGIPDDVAPAQAARAMSNQIALELRNPAGGAGMPGALSDKDREFLLQSIPGLENDPAAIGKMIEYRVKLAQREQQVAKMAREYRKKHGKFDEGFYDDLKTWSDKNPLFPAPSKSAKSIVRTGTLNGKKVVEYDDGSVGYVE